MVAARQPWLLSSLQSRGQIFGNIGPNWFASVMGTGIVATAAATLPVQIPGQPVFAQVVWTLAALLLVVVVVAVAAHWVRTGCAIRPWPAAMPTTRRWRTSTAPHPWPS